MIECSNFSRCRMEQPEEVIEEFIEESSDEEVEVVLPAVQVEPLNVEVAGIPDNPESPSPQSDSPHPSPASPQQSPLIGGPPMPPPPSSPREISGSFMNFYTYSDGSSAVLGRRPFCMSCPAVLVVKIWSCIKKNTKVR